jgi:hypothetical protein
MSARRGNELYEVKPRETDGAKTEEAYEFQFHQAAADALEVLDDAQVACVYCDWHDDYVIETAGVASYRFHQVKTRKASKGPWRANEFFGIAKAPARLSKTVSGPRQLAGARTDSIFGRLLDHVRRFGTRCGWFVFVTDAGVESDFEKLLAAVRAVEQYEDLPAAIDETFARLHWALARAFSPLSLDDFWEFLRRLHVREPVGRLSDLKGIRNIIGGRIVELSEVKLHVSEAQKIASELVFAVRERSHRVVTPATAAELRATKGLVLDDLLRILSLSPAGYRELRAGGRSTVVALSRLHRLCKEGGMGEHLIADVCRLKATWDSWWAQQRHAVNGLDHVALKKACADVLGLHSDGKLDFDGVNREAKSLAAKYGPILTSSEALSPELVFGLMMALAAEAAT